MNPCSSPMNTDNGAISCSLVLRNASQTAANDRALSDLRFSDADAYTNSRMRVMNVAVTATPTKQHPANTLANSCVVLPVNKVLWTLFHRLVVKIRCSNVNIENQTVAPCKHEPASGHDVGRVTTKMSKFYAKNRNKLVARRAPKTKNTPRTEPTDGTLFRKILTSRTRRAFATPPEDRKCSKSVRRRSFGHAIRFCLSVWRTRARANKSEGRTGRVHLKSTGV